MANRQRKKWLKQNTHQSTNKIYTAEKITKISWRYIWRTYFLEFNGIILDDDNQLLSHYNIRNKSVLGFVKRTKKLRLK